MSFGYILYKIKINSNKFLKSYADLSEPVRIPLSVMLTKEAANNSKLHWRRDLHGFWTLCETFKKFVGVEYFFVTFFYKIYSKEQLLNTEKTPLTNIIISTLLCFAFLFTFSLSLFSVSSLSCLLSLFCYFTYRKFSIKPPSQISPLPLTLISHPPFSGEESS